MISGIFRDYYCGIFGYCSKHYIFKKYFLRVDCPFKCDEIKALNFRYSKNETGFSFSAQHLLSKILAKIYRRQICMAV